jgi:hypothetical protein
VCDAVGCIEDGLIPYAQWRTVEDERDGFWLKHQAREVRLCKRHADQLIGLGRDWAALECDVPWVDFRAEGGG